jgi:hypothetical protein
MSDLQKEKEDLLFVFKKVCETTKKLNCREERIFDWELSNRIVSYLKKETNEVERNDFLRKLFELELSAYEYRINKKIQEGTLDYHNNDKPLSHNIIISKIFKRSKKELKVFFKSDRDFFLNLMFSISRNSIERTESNFSIKMFNKEMKKEKVIDIKERPLGTFFISEILNNESNGRKYYLKLTEETKAILNKSIQYLSKDPFFKRLVREKMKFTDWYLYPLGFIIMIFVLPFIIPTGIVMEILNRGAEREKDKGYNKIVDYYDYLLKEGSEHKLIEFLLDYRLKNPESFSNEGKLLDSELFELMYKK